MLLGLQRQAEFHHDAGLLPALSWFTAATWQAVQQLGTVDDQQRAQLQPQQQGQRQQQQDDEARQRTTLILVVELLALWLSILQHALASPRPDMSFGTALPALIGLTSSFSSLLEDIEAHFDSMCGASSNLLAACDLGLDSVSGTLTSWTLAKYIVSLNWRQPQQAQDLYHTPQLAELLLQLLASQAGQLHTACGGVSQALQGRHTATANQTQQQDQQRPLFAGCVVPQSHLALLQILRAKESPSDSAGFKAQDIQGLLQEYTRTLHAVCSAVLPRCKRVDQLSSSPDSSCSTDDADQQQLETTYTDVPSRWLVPVIKTLLEVVLLAPPYNSLAVHAGSLNAVLLLLHITTTLLGLEVPAATAAAAADGRQQHQEVSASCPWPQLPVEVAAGLLRPVLAQLPQAVMYCLLQTEQLQQQHLKTDRLVLLHNYGCLLMAVCQSGGCRVGSCGRYYISGSLFEVEISRSGHDLTTAR